MLIHIFLGTRGLRLRISNAFGVQPFLVIFCKTQDSRGMALCLPIPNMLARYPSTHYRHGYDPTSVKSHLRWRCLFTRDGRFRPPPLAHHDRFSPYHRHPSRPRITLHTLLQAGTHRFTLGTWYSTCASTAYNYVYFAGHSSEVVNGLLNSWYFNNGAPRSAGTLLLLLRMVTVARWIGAALVSPLFIASCIQIQARGQLHSR